MASIVHSTLLATEASFQFSGSKYSELRTYGEDVSRLASSASYPFDTITFQIQ